MPLPRPHRVTVEPLRSPLVTPSKASKRIRYAGPKYPGVDGKLRLRTLDDLDKRTAAAQHAIGFRDAVAADRGGLDRLTAAERELIEGAAILSAMIRDMGVAYLGGEKIDALAYMALLNAQRRTLETIGLDRRPRDVSPSLSEYLQTKRRAAG